MLRIVLVALVVGSLFVGAAPIAAATHVPVCWSVPPDFVDVDWVEGNPVCAVDFAWDSFTMFRPKSLVGCLQMITG